MKEYKTLEEQIEYLISNKKIDKETIDLKIFNKTAYLNIITLYTDLIAIGRAKDEVKVFWKGFFYYEDCTKV